MVKITRKHGTVKDRHVSPPNGAEADLIYSILSPTKIIADHTAMPNARRARQARGLMRRV
jgi:hypothetical protein